MLSKEKRDAPRVCFEVTDANDAIPCVKEWAAAFFALLTHAEATNTELARLADELGREKEWRERAERGLDFFTSGDWVI